MTLDFNEEAHAYTLDGKPVPSVTEIVGILTARKYADTNAALLQQAQRRGTAVHELCEMLDFGVDPEELDIDPDLVGYINAYLAFLRDYRPEWEWIEKPVFTMDYAGRIDRVGTIDGKTAIVDIKTTASMDRLSRISLLLQLFLYREAFNYSVADPGPAVKTLMGVQLKKNGTYTVHDTKKILGKDLAHHDVYRILDDLLEIQTLIGGYKTE